MWSRNLEYCLTFHGKLHTFLFWVQIVKFALSLMGNLIAMQSDSPAYLAVMDSLLLRNQLAIYLNKAITETVENLKDSCCILNVVSR